SMVTTKPGHTCFNIEDNDALCTIYFMKWQTFNPDKEFRVFVYKNEITAISAQHLYSINEWLNTLDDGQISNIINKILSFFKTDIRDKLLYLENYTFDFAFTESSSVHSSHSMTPPEQDEPNDTPYFLEPNGFGRHYAAGSALYHWIYDHDTLHDSEIIEFRYVNEY
ncbi:MAG: cell division cycle 123 family protein, partial [Nitrososphaeraceae archaeon]|nr:cell division cycle 123 family protein [Nitrososphaeraceae archaeon]